MPLEFQSYLWNWLKLTHFTIVKTPRESGAMRVSLQAGILPTRSDGLEGSAPRGSSHNRGRLQRCMGSPDGCLCCRHLYCRAGVQCQFALISEVVDHTKLLFPKDFRRRECDTFSNHGSRVEPCLTAQFVRTQWRPIMKTCCKLSRVSRRLKSLIMVSWALVMRLKLISFL